MQRFRLIRKYLAPRWLTEGEGELVGYSLDVMADAFVERVRLGLMARLPQNDPTGATTAPEDALAALGRDRRVVRGINETAQSYAARLLKWLDDRKAAGTAYSLMQKLAEYTGPLPKFRVVDARGNWYTREPSGAMSYVLKRANWNWDNAAASRWSRFWVIVYPNGLWTVGNTWGSENWGANANSWGSTAPVEQVATIRSIVSDWKPAGTKCVHIIEAFDNASFDPAAAALAPGMPDGLWGSWSKNVAGTQVAARLATARYWDGV